jgi:ATP-dependent Clp protease protease subunit
MDSPLLNHRILFLQGTVDTQTANNLIQQLLYLNARNPAEPIDLYINSPGGSVHDGLAIIDAMLCIKAPIRTVCIGRASSMAAWILAAGAKGERYATPNAEIMLHQMASQIVEQQTSHLSSFAGHVARLQKRLIQLLSQWTCQSEKRIERDIEVELFMTAEEAREFGLVDHIMEYQKK